MNLPIASLLLIFMAAVFAADPPLNQTKDVNEFLDFEDNSDADEVPSTESKGITDVPIITATPISISAAAAALTTKNSSSTTTSSATSDSTTVSSTSVDTTASPQSSTPSTTTSSPTSTAFTTSDSTTTESTTFTSTTDSTTATDSTTSDSTTTESPTSTSTTDSTTATDSTTSDSTTTESTTSTSTTDSTTATGSTTSDSTTTESTTSTSTTESTTATGSTTSDSTTTESTTSTSTTDFTTATDSTTSDSTTSTSTTDSSTATDSTTSKSPTTVSTTTVSTTTLPTTTLPTTTVPSTTTEQQTEEEFILALLAENSASLTQSNSLLNAISTINLNIIADLDSQSNSLDLIEDTERLLQNKTKELLSWEAELLRGVVTSIQKIDLFANRTIDTFSQLLKLQKQNHDRVKDLGDRLNVTEGQILRSSKGLDNKLNFVGQLLQRFVELKVNSLKESFANLNTSQINSKIELDNVPLVRNLTGNSIIKLSALNNQLAVLNQTQEKSFDSLKAAVKAWAPTNLNAINDLFQTISISQKRTDLAVAICGSSEYNLKGHSNHFESYNTQAISNDSEDPDHRRITRNQESVEDEILDPSAESSWSVVASA
ncbi:uncharacterized protein [Drosophila takahashii]|uniref:uncharacterized protein n=1 Tax=Drosophila takahashii TaxID=29030 RepID=UPI003898FEEB